MVHQRNRRIHSGHGFIGSFDAPWSEWSWIIDPDPDHPKGTHPEFSRFVGFSQRLLGSVDLLGGLGALLRSFGVLLGSLSLLGSVALLGSVDLLGCLGALLRSFGALLGSLSLLSSVSLSQSSNLTEEMLPRSKLEMVNATGGVQFLNKLLTSCLSSGMSEICDRENKNVETCCET